MQIGGVSITWRGLLAALLACALIFGAVWLVHKFAWEYPLVALTIIGVLLIVSRGFRQSFFSALANHAIEIAWVAAFVLLVYMCTRG